MGLCHRHRLGSLLPFLFNNKSMYDITARELAHLITPYSRLLELVLDKQGVCTCVCLCVYVPVSVWSYIVMLAHQKPSLLFWMQIVTDVVHMINDFAVWPVSVKNATSSRSIFWLESMYKFTQLPLSVCIIIQPSVLWSQCTKVVYSQYTYDIIIFSELSPFPLQNDRSIWNHYECNSTWWGLWQLVGWGKPCGTFGREGKPLIQKIQYTLIKWLMKSHKKVLCMYGWNPQDPTKQDGNDITILLHYPMIQLNNEAIGYIGWSGGARTEWKNFWCYCKWQCSSYVVRIFSKL